MAKFQSFVHFTCQVWLELKWLLSFTYSFVQHIFQGLLRSWRQVHLCQWHLCFQFHFSAQYKLLGNSKEAFFRSHVFSSVILCIFWILNNLTNNCPKYSLPSFLWRNSTQLPQISLLRLPTHSSKGNNNILECYLRIL